MLTPVARFIVDPTISHADTSLKVDEILKRCNISEDVTEEDMKFIRRMILKRKRLFSDTLGVAHGYRMSIQTPRVDSGEVPAPAFPYRKRSPASTPPYATRSISSLRLAFSPKSRALTMPCHS
jgi:hypothetical protein